MSTCLGQGTPLHLTTHGHVRVHAVVSEYTRSCPSTRSRIRVHTVVSEYTQSYPSTYGHNHIHAVVTEYTRSHPSARGPIQVLVQTVASECTAHERVCTALHERATWRSLDSHELAGGSLDELVEVCVEVRAPEATSAAPGLGREARAGDAVEDARDGAARQRVLAAVDLHERAHVTAYSLLASGVRSVLQRQHNSCQ